MHAWLDEKEECALDCTSASALQPFTPPLSPSSALTGVIVFMELRVHILWAGILACVYFLFSLLHQAVKVAEQCNTSHGVLNRPPLVKCRDPHAAKANLLQQKQHPLHCIIIGCATLWSVADVQDDVF